MAAALISDVAQGSLSALRPLVGQRPGRRKLAKAAGLRANLLRPKSASTPPISLTAAP